MTGRRTLRVLVTAVTLTAGLTTGLATAGAAGAATHHTPVLGKKGLFAPSGRGWGTYEPARIDNGGDPSGIVTHVHWKHWGAATATGTGLTSAFRPTGGYYAKPVHIQLRATTLDRCSASGPQAYRQLLFREQTKPGSATWTRWHTWAGLTSICARVYAH